MPAISKRKTYTKRKSSKKSRTNRRLGKWKVRRWLRNRKPYKVAKLINVANNHEVEKKVVKVQKISNKQRNIVRKRFREGYSPFIDRNTSYLQLVSSDNYNNANWVSFIGLKVSEIYEYFRQFPYEDKISGDSDDVTLSSYKVSETQSLYIGNVVETLEIANPTNYDVNLVVYDFIYKDNVILFDINDEIEDGGQSKTSSYGPLGLINKGLNANYLVESGTAHYNVADPTNIHSLRPINLKPTDSYPFNMYCKIVKKTVYRLQPGASLKHIFIIKPKALINRGYFGFKFNVSDSGIGKGAMKDVTYGMVCKTWGQIANSGNALRGHENEVTNLAGSITYKRTKEVKWYAMDSKYTYIRNNDDAWTPTLNLERPEVVNDESIKVAATMNLDPRDNNDQAQASTSG